MLNAIRNRHLLASDLLLIPLAAYGGFALRLESFDLGAYHTTFLVFALVAVVVVPVTLALTGIYARYWRYASIEELLRISAALGSATLAAGVIMALLRQPLGLAAPMPQSVLVIFLFLALIVVAGPRYAIRLADRYAPRRGARTSRVVIIGAGDSGAMVARHLRQQPHVTAVPIGFIDDDFSKRTRIYDLPVLGGVKDIPELASRFGIDEAVIAIPGASGKTISAIVATCEGAGVKPRLVPAVQDLLNDKVSVSQIRDVQIEDLLRREPIQTDISAVHAGISGKRVLVTGGGGSIGSELCRQLLRCLPSELIILGHGENSIFEIHNELRRTIDTDDAALKAVVLRPVIADVRFPERLREVFSSYRPEVVYHAAAHKHVPLMEANPSEAISTNVMGTRFLLEAATEAQVERFVLISSDKAVNPTSVMGASKRVAELLVHQTAKRTGRPYMAVRFGNVLGSRGSVVLTFRKQIAAGGPVTVTHPEMRRFFMTIPEAVQLVLQASVLGAGGEVFMLDMGEPIKIIDLARSMIELSGLKPEHDIDIVTTGLRPGEKLYEELFIPGETYMPTIHQQIFIASSASRPPIDGLDPWVSALEGAALRQDLVALFGVLRTLIPEQRFEHSSAAQAQTLWPEPTSSPELFLHAEQLPTASITVAGQLA